MMIVTAWEGKQPIRTIAPMAAFHYFTYVNNTGYIFFQTGLGKEMFALQICKPAHNISTCLIVNTGFRNEANLTWHRVIKCSLMPNSVISPSI